jgi:hypothetical protein
VLLRECEILDVAASKLLLKLSFDEALFLDALHRNVKAMEVTLEFSRAGLPHPLLGSEKFWVVGIDYASSLLKLN